MGGFMVLNYISLKLFKKKTTQLFKKKAVDLYCLYKMLTKIY